MDTRTGEIADLEEFHRRYPTMEPDEFAARFKPIDTSNLSLAVRESLERHNKANIGRNSICPCGSGLKFKRCCLSGPL